MIKKITWLLVVIFLVSSADAWTAPWSKKEKKRGTSSGMSQKAREYHQKRFEKRHPRKTRKMTKADVKIKEAQKKRNERKKR